MNGKRHAVAVLVETEDGSTPLIRDPKKPAPIYWKIPGGRGEPGEDARHVAIRETEEETGISVFPDNLHLVHQEDKGNHVFSLFWIKVPSLIGLKEFGNEGEEIKVFKVAEIGKMPDFFPPHRKALKEALLL